MYFSSTPIDLKKLLEAVDKVDFLAVFLLVDGLGGMGGLELFVSF